MLTLGFDTSNYTTSVAAFDGVGGKNCSRLLDVKPGELGLRQSDALFAHIKVRITERAKQHKETEVIFYDVSGLREAQKQLNAIVADNQIALTAPAHLYALVGESSVKAEFVNNSKNDTYKVEIRRNKDNTLIADAFELAAGKSISTLTLLEAPEFGNVHCTVTITAYRDGKQIGTLNTELTLHTAYLWPKEVQ